MAQARLHIEDEAASGEPLEGSGFEDETSEDPDAPTEIEETTDEEASRG